MSRIIHFECPECFDSFKMECEGSGIVYCPSCGYAAHSAKPGFPYIKLKRDACPFCGGRDTRIIPYDDEGCEITDDIFEDILWNEDMDENCLDSYAYLWSVTCECGASYCAKSGEEAVIGWNNRYDSRRDAQ